MKWHLGKWSQSKREGGEKERRNILLILEVGHLLSQPRFWQSSLSCYESKVHTSGGVRAFVGVLDIAWHVGHLQYWPASRQNICSIVLEDVLPNCILCFAEKGLKRRNLKSILSLCLLHNPAFSSKRRFFRSPPEYKEADHPFPMCHSLYQWCSFFSLSRRPPTSHFAPMT